VRIAATAQADQFTRFDAEVLQLERERVRARVELGIGHPDVAADDGDGIGRGRGLARDQGLDAQRAIVRERGGIEGGQQRALRRRRRERVGERECRLRGAALERGTIELEPAADRRGVEQSRVVLALEVQPAVGLRDVQEHLEVLGVARFADDAHRQALVRQRAGRDRGVEVEQHRHERQPRRVALDLQLLQQAAERDALVVVRVEHHAARGGHLRRGRLVDVDRDADRQEVDAVPDEPGLPRDRLPGRRHADDQVVAARQAGQQPGVDREQRREQARVLLRAEALDGVGERRVDRQVLAARREAAVRRGARAIGGQVERRDRAVVDPDPPAFVGGLLRGRSDWRCARRVVAVERRGLEERRLARSEGAVQRHQLVREHAERPSVAHDVVRRQHQLRAIGAAAHQHGAKQRAAREIEAGLDGGRALCAQRGVALVRGQGREIDEPRLERDAADDPQLGAVRADGAAQRLVALAERAQRGRECRLVERAVEMQRSGFVVGERGLVAEAIGEPDLALRLGRRHDALDVADVALPERVLRRAAHRCDAELETPLIHFCLPGGVHTPLLLIGLPGRDDAPRQRTSTYLPGSSGLGTYQRASPSGPRPSFAPGTGGFVTSSTAGSCTVRAGRNSEACSSATDSRNADLIVAMSCGVCAVVMKQGKLSRMCTPRLRIIANSRSCSG
jgi:hypothetical protein